MKHKVNRKFIIEKIDKHIVIFDPQESILLELNTSATFIFKKLRAGLNYAELTKVLSKSYDIPLSIAEKEITEFITSLSHNKILIVSS